MLIRIVKMTFNEEAVPVFLEFFRERKQQIRHFPGCSHLELWQDKHQPATWFTYSHWESEEALNHYRYSEFFRETWAFTRQHFVAKPEAYSIQQVVIEN